jgi:hypothetical protein
MFAILVVKLSASTTAGLSRGVTPTLAFTLANPRGAQIHYPAGRINIGER